MGLSNHQRNNISTGINYASGGSGILPDTNNDTSLTMERQIMLFHRTVKHNLPKMFTEKEKLEKHISESLFFVSTGVNDYFKNGTFRGNRNFSWLLIKEISVHIMKMYNLGARKFLVNNIPPAGCSPTKAIHTRPMGKCDENINKVINFYNTGLPEALHELQYLLPGFTFIHSDLYGFIKKMREIGSNYGIAETWKPCCPNTIHGDLKCHPYTIPAMYIFGDSLVDSGNNNRLGLKGAANFFPFGIDFGGKSTGRYTNGKTVVDHLGLSNQQRNKISTGVNYASGGSGILPDTSNTTALTLDSQIKFFKSTVQHNLAKLLNDEKEVEKHISESLFVVSTGVNDYFNNGTFRGNRKLALHMLSEFSVRIQRMYSLGARKFFVNNIAPAGCFPSISVRTRPKGKCDKKINKPITFYNTRLPKVLHELQSKLPGFTFIHSDLYGFLMNLRENAKSYGKKKTKWLIRFIYGSWKHGNLAAPIPSMVR
ncbi:unnamed protein product [Sphenostylis stenocarpa]|uniref:Uncharacterized protein n=1 Tax=Sphenostylis stenocarpa TaxID=92480 RepID=A0AA86SJY7_9FABA|nr:unnamed protein product [Sphenostylis stenocarpa]